MGAEGEVLLYRWDLCMLVPVLMRPQAKKNWALLPVSAPRIRIRAPRTSGARAWLVLLGGGFRRYHDDPCILLSVLMRHQGSIN